MTTVPSPKSFASNGNGTGHKLYILAASVLMHDPEALFQFAEHNLLIPLAVLEELSDLNRGTSETAHNAREASRILEAIIAANEEAVVEQGFPLEKASNGKATGRLFIQTGTIDPRRRKKIGDKTDDILFALAGHLPDYLQVLRSSAVILVTKNPTTRVKAKIQAIKAEDYRNDRAIEDAELLYKGHRTLPETFWEQTGNNLESVQSGDHVDYIVKSAACADAVPNEFFYMNDLKGGQLHLVVAEKKPDSLILRTVRDYTHGKNRVCGITARNQEQRSALHLFMNPNIDFVTVMGKVGSGKTILALAAGIQQVLDGRYKKIMYIKETMPLGREDGFLPGDEKEKLGPWSGPIFDNLEVLMAASPVIENWFKTRPKRTSPMGRPLTLMELLDDLIEIKSLNHFRGRSLFQRYVMLDELQNFTKHQTKTLITRAGQGSKMVALGNLAQIDTPFLTPTTSGATHAVESFKGWPHSGHIILEHCERSRLADHGGLVL